MSKEMAGTLSLLVSAAIYGSFGVLIRWMGQEVDVQSQIIVRYFLALLILILVFLIAKPILKVTRKSLIYLGLFAVFMQISIWSFTKGAILTSIPSLLGSFYMGSIITATIIGIFFFKEK